MLSQIRRLVASKSLLFSKDHALDCLLQLKILSKESNHPKAGFYSAILDALREKISCHDDQFKKYISVLLGDKDQEKVLDMISKVDKAAKVKPPSDSSSDAGPSGSSLRVKRRYRRLDGVRCFNCGRFGHYQNQCPDRQEHSGYGPPPKRMKGPQSPQK